MSCTSAEGHAGQPDGALRGAWALHAHARPITEAGAVADSITQPRAASMPTTQCLKATHANEARPRCCAALGILPQAHNLYAIAPNHTKITPCSKVLGNGLIKEDVVGHAEFVHPQVHAGSLAVGHAVWQQIASTAGSQGIQPCRAPEGPPPSMTLLDDEEEGASHADVRRGGLGAVCVRHFTCSAKWCLHEAAQVALDDLQR